MGYTRFEFQIVDGLGRPVTASGGAIYVVPTGTQAKTALYNVDDNTALSNALSLTSGKAKFLVADTVTAIDVFGIAGDGRAIRAINVKPGATFIPTSNDLRQELMLPWSIADQTATTAYDWGIDLPANALVQPFGTGLLISTTDSGITADLGLLASESGGDADGFLDGLSCATAGAVLPALTFNSGTDYPTATTFGVLIQSFTAGSATDDRGLAINKQHRCDGTAKSLVITLSSGADTATGYAIVSYVMAAAI